RGHRQAPDRLRLPRPDPELPGRRHADGRADRERIAARAGPLHRRHDPDPRRDPRDRGRPPGPRGQPAQARAAHRPAGVGQRVEARLPARAGRVPAAVAEAAEVLAAGLARGQRVRRQERVLRLHRGRCLRRGQRRGLMRHARLAPGRPASAGRSFMCRTFTSQQAFNVFLTCCAGASRVAPPASGPINNHWKVFPMKNTLALAAALALAALSTDAIAGQPFVRAEAGSSDIEVNYGRGFRDTESDTAVTVGGGYWFTPNIGVEGHVGTLYTEYLGRGYDLDLVTAGAGLVA